MFRVHFGIRVRCDEFPAAALNGPAFDALPSVGALRKTRSFDFRSGPGALDTCAELMGELVATAGAEWFEALKKPGMLLSPDTSPLGAEPIAALQRALNSPEVIVTSPQTRRALSVD